MKKMAEHHAKQSAEGQGRGKYPTRGAGAEADQGRHQSHRKDEEQGRHRILIPHQMGDQFGTAPRDSRRKQRQDAKGASHQHADGNKAVTFVLVQRQIAILTGQHQLIEDKAEHPEHAPHKEEQPECLQCRGIIVR